MPRPFKFPDPNDRTPNSPIFLVSPEQVLGYYNQENSKEKQSRVNQKVTEWYMVEALRQGWRKSKFLGNQCLLEMEFKKVA